MARGSRVALRFGLILAVVIAAAVITWAASPMGSEPTYRPQLQLVY
jgi:hypothetical protein